MKQAYVKEVFKKYAIPFTELFRSLTSKGYMEATFSRDGILNVQ